MNDLRIEPQWIVTGAALVMLGTGGYLAYGAYQRRSRRKGLLARLERIGYQAAHQVLVPDGRTSSRRPPPSVTAYALSRGFALSMVTGLSR